MTDFQSARGTKLFFTECKQEDHFDLVITIGGDGTILWAHKLLDREEMPPFVCFDGGSLCFLSNFTMDKAEETLAFLHEKMSKKEPFDTFSLSRIKSFVKENIIYLQFRKRTEEKSEEEEPHYSINDVVVERREANVVKLDILINGIYACSINSDGVLICSSTGSTAYNMSLNNGVVLHPDLNSLIINPINAMSLSIRPLVLPGKTEITLRVLTHVLPLDARGFEEHPKGML